MSVTTCKCAERCVILFLLVFTISLFYSLIGKGPVIFKYGLRKESRSENNYVIISCKYSELERMLLQWLVNHLKWTNVCFLSVGNNLKQETFYRSLYIGALPNSPIDPNSKQIALTLTNTLKNIFEFYSLNESVSAGF